MGNNTNYTATYSYLANPPMVGQIPSAQSTANRLITTKQYDNLNRLSSIGSVPSADSPLVYGYQYTDGKETVDGRWNYTWDAENRLVRMVANTAGTGSPATYNRFIYHGWNLLAELDGNNTNAIVRSYNWGSDLSGSKQGAGGVGGLLMINDPTTVATHFVAYDGNGNVAATVGGSAATTTATYEYGLFGEVIRYTGPISKTNHYRSSTKYQDNETDLLYYGYRYYDQSTGRWLSRDPIAEKGGAPLYGFVRNFPLELIDKWGLSCVTYSRQIKSNLPQIPPTPLPFPLLSFSAELEFSVDMRITQCDTCCGTKLGVTLDYLVGLSASVSVTLVFGGYKQLSVAEGYEAKGWLGIQGDFSSRASTSYSFSTSDCEPSSTSMKICLDTEFGGSLSGGGEFEIILKYWSATVSSKIVGQASLPCQACFNISPSGASFAGFPCGQWTGSVTGTLCFGGCLSWNIW